MPVQAPGMMLQRREEETQATPRYFSGSSADLQILRYRIVVGAR